MSILCCKDKIVIGVLSINSEAPISDIHSSDFGPLVCILRSQFEKGPTLVLKLERSVLSMLKIISVGCKNIDILSFCRPLTLLP